MRWTQTLIPTVKEDPAEAEAVSHKLMMRAGIIRKLSAGTYIYLPLGVRALLKAANIVREEMNRAGASEVLMPALQTPELWERTGRLSAFGEIIFQFPDRTGKVHLLGPTHEEVITYLVANEINSYRQLPLNLYQIQTKFRDEIRPRFGVIRSKEFLMKDAYSFDVDEKGLDASYKSMYGAYCRIFDRCGLKYHIIEAESGLMGGSASHEFIAPSPSGEDIFVYCPKCNYGANLNMAQRDTKELKNERTKELKPLKEVSTPDASSIEAVSKMLNVRPDQMVKTMLCMAGSKPVAVLIRGDHELNLLKLSRLLNEPQVALAETAVIEKVTGGPMGFSGPVGLKDIEIIADYSVMDMANFVTGANKKDTHLVNTNIDRDFRITQTADVRQVVDGDLCPRCQTAVKTSHGIELGHIFKLGTKYSKSLEAMYIDEKGNRHPIVMGCYGIGINRILAAMIENSYDKDGIIWSQELAPYRVLIISINPNDPVIKDHSEKLYRQLSSDTANEVLWDDRDISPGIKFKDADLIGIPVIVTVGKATIKDNTVDIKLRRDNTKQTIPFDRAAEEINKLTCSEPFGSLQSRRGGISESV
jgi:prolyl-tRNA synthetase